MTACTRVLCAFNRLFVMFWLLLCCNVAPAAERVLQTRPAPTPPGNVEFQPDITYAMVGGEPLKLNLSRPKTADPKTPLPCILVIHGGAWRGGHRNGHNDITWNCASKGYVSATLSYRLCPKHPFPAQVQDVKAAVRFLRANSDKYGLDPKRIGAMGFSAGAHLSMMLGTMDKEDGLDDVGEYTDQSSKVQAVVAFFGPTDFTLPYPDVTKPLIKDFLNGDPAEIPHIAKRASPITYVTPGDAAMLLYQGTKDPLVPHEQAIAMTEALTKAGVPGRVELLIGAGHGWGTGELNRTAEGTFEFFQEKLKLPAMAKAK
jgi:acetyl esterase/lipase